MADAPPLVALDANAVDRVATGRDPVVRAFGHLAASGRFRVLVLPGVAAEVAHARPPARLPTHQATATRPTPRQAIDRLRLRAILRGDGRAGKHDADAGHLSEAAEAGCRYFVTADGKMLRRRDVLAAALPPGFRIVTLDELVDLLDRDGESGEFDST